MANGNPTPVLILIVGAIWLIFTLTFILPVTRARRRRQRDIAWLKAHGWRVNVTVAAIEDARSHAHRFTLDVITGGNHVLVADVWDDPADPAAERRVTFVSDPLRGSFATDVIGATVDVLVDPDAPHRYWMDPASLR